MTAISFPFQRIRIWRETRGTAAIEFAFVLFILLMLSIPVADFGRYILTMQKVNKTAMTIADMTAMSLPVPVPPDPPLINNSPEIITETRLQALAETAHNMLLPFRGQTLDGLTIIVSSVYKGADAPQVMWQGVYRVTGDGNNAGSPDYTGYTDQFEMNPPQWDANTPKNSSIGVKDGPATLPPVLQNNIVNDTGLIAVEIFYDFRPILTFAQTRLSFLGQRTISAQYYFPNRYGALKEIYDDIP